MEDETFEDVMADGPTDYSKHVAFVLFDFDKFDAWLDRLKDAHEREVDALRGETYLDAVSDSVLVKHGLVRLPKDKDGVTIRVGDTLDGYGKTIEVRQLTLGDDGWSMTCENGLWFDFTALAFTHHHEPTVEDVLREFGDEMNQNLGMYTGEVIDADEWRDADAKTVEKFAAKLRLAGGEDA